MMPELENYLKHWFYLTAADLEVIGNLFEVREMKRGDYYLKAGHYANDLSFIQTGIIRVYADHKNKEVTQWLATQGYFLTDLRSLIFDDTARWNMVALSDCKLYSISKENYKKIGALVENWAELEKRFLANCFITLENRVFEFLSSSAQERYSRYFLENKEMFNQVPLQYIASMLGMTPETFSRIRAKSSGK